MMKKFISLIIIAACLVCTFGCADIQDPNSSSTDNTQTAVDYKSYTVTAAYDYGFHITDKLSMLYSGSTLFFDLPKDCGNVIAGDTFTIKYSGELMILESYPSSVVIQNGRIETVEYQKAKLIKLTYHAPTEVSEEYFEAEHLNGTSEPIKIACRPDYFITNVENGEFDSLSEITSDITLYGTYSAIDGLNEETGYNLLGLYAYNPEQS